MWSVPPRDVWRRVILGVVTVGGAGGMHRLAQKPVGEGRRPALSVRSAECDAQERVMLVYCPQCPQHSIAGGAQEPETILAGSDLTQAEVERPTERPMLPSAPPVGLGTMLSQSASLELGLVRGVLGKDDGQLPPRSLVLVMDWGSQSAVEEYLRPERFVLETPVQQMERLQYDCQPPRRAQAVALRNPGGDEGCDSRDVDSPTDLPVSVQVCSKQVLQCRFVGEGQNVPLDLTVVPTTARSEPKSALPERAVLLTSITVNPVETTRQRALPQVELEELCERQRPPPQVGFEPSFHADHAKSVELDSMKFSSGFTILSAAVANNGVAMNGAGDNRVREKSIDVLDVSTTATTYESVLLPGAELASETCLGEVKALMKIPGDRIVRCVVFDDVFSMLADKEDTRQVKVGAPVYNAARSSGRLHLNTDDNKVCIVHSLSNALYNYGSGCRPIKENMHMLHDKLNREFLDVSLQQASKLNMPNLPFDGVCQQHGKAITEYDERMKCHREKVLSDYDAYHLSRRGELECERMPAEQVRLTDRDGKSFAGR